MGLEVDSVHTILDIIPHSGFSAQRCLPACLSVWFLEANSKDPFAVGAVRIQWESERGKVERKRETERCL